MSWRACTTWWMPARSQQAELLDAADIPPDDLSGNLRDLRRLNQYLGSCWIVVRAVRRFWRHAGRPKQLHILDIGTGAGDIPLALHRWGRRCGVQLTIVAMDNHAGITAYARTGLHATPAVTLLRADGLQLPFHAQTFDVVVCSTMLHHLTWHEGVALLQAMATVARHGIVVNDLRRSRLHYYGARLLLSLVSRNRLTRHDGPLSVLRAYRVAEVREMARVAGLPRARVSQVWGYRLLLMAG